MATTKTYYEKLKDPRWQKRRLEVLQAAVFRCELCGSSDDTLHVHHGYYSRGNEPWDYPIDTMHCLCESCHYDVQRELTEVHELIATLHPRAIYDLSHLIRGMHTS